GRLYHLPGKDYTLVDYNRAGLPLMELVTKPDLENSSDVLKFASELRLLMRYLGASDADMEKGQMRVEVNISLRPEGTETLGTKVEVKNINSISAAGKAVEYEIVRQTEALEAGEKIIQETRGWDDIHNKTVSQRTKEGSADYRYFPEPDLPPMKFQDSAIEEIRAALPELPSQRRERFAHEYSLPEKDIETLTTNRQLGDYFEKAVSEALAEEKLSDEDQKRLIKLTSNYIITEYQRRLTELSANPFDTKVDPEMFGEFIMAVFKGAVSSSAAQTLLNEMLQTGLHADHLIHEKDLGQVSDTDELNKIIEQVIAENEKAAEDFKKGKEASLKFLVGKVMATSKGKANPQVVQELIKQKLS
ncbi:MAG: Asp-tRNA(Asn)/Glu-tRNA(Gln) amidotransferase subunit GatB, partial [Candidatus Yanofskybacteria bacterium]|nr:Asp-tRNA(Asn)/Glu-tRNA(Gln) amidotransferase subunit GatB [Candidatus Yanofskybacteria bacterium]